MIIVTNYVSIQNMYRIFNLTFYLGFGFEPRKRFRKKEQNIFKWNINDPASYAFYVRRLRKILYSKLLY